VSRNRDRSTLGEDDQVCESDLDSDDDGELEDRQADETHLGVFGRAARKGISSPRFRVRLKSKGMATERSRSQLHQVEDLLNCPQALSDRRRSRYGGRPGERPTETVCRRLDDLSVLLKIHPFLFDGLPGYITNEQSAEANTLRSWGSATPPSAQASVYATLRQRALNGLVQVSETMQLMTVAAAGGLVDSHSLPALDFERRIRSKSKHPPRHEQRQAAASKRQRVVREKE
jgi:hypothetical protein